MKKMTYAAILNGGNVNYINLHSQNRTRYPNTYIHEPKFNLNSVFYTDTDLPALKSIHPDIYFVPRNEYYKKYDRGNMCK